MVENKSNGSNGNNAYININSRKKYENNTEIINNNCDNNNIDDNYSYTEGGWRKRYERGRGKKKKRFKLSGLVGCPKLPPATNSPGPLPHPQVAHCSILMSVIYWLVMVFLVYVLTGVHGAWKTG